MNCNNCPLQIEGECIALGNFCFLVSEELSNEALRMAANCEDE